MSAGHRLQDINLRSLHECCGLVAQDTQLFGANIEENVAYGLEEDEYTEADLQAALEKANAWEYVSKVRKTPSWPRSWASFSLL